MNFLGSTTPTDLLALVTSGVQDTGEALWPLFVFVGIGAAFVIAFELARFIDFSITQRSFGLRGRLISSYIAYRRAPKDD